jgi:cytochrome c biogenesis protein ResB
MRTEITYQTVELGDIVQKIDENGMLYDEFVPDGETIEVATTDIYSGEGKVFKRKSDNAILSTHITIGTDDSINNYEEVDI